MLALADPRTSLPLAQASGEGRVLLGFNEPDLASQSNMSAAQALALWPRLMATGIYARYHLPVWVTEFALTSYSGGTATFPSEAQQAAFLTAATTMLDGLSYVERYAWFALPVSAGSGTTGLFNPGLSVTRVGRAFESAR